MFSTSQRARAALLAAVCGVTMLASAGSAQAVELQGPWAPFNQCPVDDAQMLAVPNSGNGCVASVSPHGTFKIGGTTVTTGRTELQFGATGPGIPNVIAPGYLAAEPVRIPGGLLGLVCPASNPLVSNLCRSVADGSVNAVTATVELAGAVREFDLFAPLNGGPLVTLPAKIRLQNPLLGANCTIGSNSNPILLKPHQEPAATGISFDPDPLGSKASFIRTQPTPVTLLDETFSVPRASGCGLLGLLDQAVNSKLGLPSPSGANRLVQEEAVAEVVGNAPSGQALSDAWHAAVVPGF
jgi:hypothetical protein